MRASGSISNGVPNVGELIQSQSLIEHLRGEIGPQPLITADRVSAALPSQNSRHRRLHGDGRIVELRELDRELERTTARRSVRRFHRPSMRIVDPVVDVHAITNAMSRRAKAQDCIPSPP